MESRRDLYYKGNTITPDKAPKPGEKQKRLHTSIPVGEMLIVSSKKPDFKPKVFMTNQCIWCGFTFRNFDYWPVCPKCRSCQYCGLYAISDYACSECGNQIDDDCKCKERKKIVIF